MLKTTTIGEICGCVLGRSTSVRWRGPTSRAEVEADDGGDYNFVARTIYLSQRRLQMLLLLMLTRRRRLDEFEEDGDEEGEADVAAKSGVVVGCCERSQWRRR